IKTIMIGPTNRSLRNLETKKLTKSLAAFYDRRVTVAAVENILKQSRSAIIDLLKVNGAMSVERLAGELEVSKVCVRRHLSLLESDGLVAFEEERHDRGRPRFIYRLTEKAARLFPQIYDEFAKEALAQVRRNFGDDALRRVLRSRADELIAQFEEKLRVYREVLGCEVVCECRIADGAKKCDFRIAPPRLTQISKRTPAR